MDVPSEINAMEAQGAKRTVDPQSFKGEIEFQNVWFRYPTRKNDWILKGLNLKILPNETVALVGESGCGKSTIVSLILRFYEVNDGSILLDGVDIRDYDLVSLRQSLGLVQQEPILFNYTISENVLYGNSNAYNRELSHATGVANAHEFIESQQIANAFDDSAESLYQEMLRNRDALTKTLGQ